MSGKLGDVVYRTSRSGKTYVSKLPKKSTKPPSEAQLAQQERFRLAHAYAALARQEPVYAGLAAKRRRSAHHIAVSDWLHPPVIHGVEHRGEHIDIYASDDVQVTKVYVTITNQEGITLEQGSATLAHEGCWSYETEVHGDVLIEVFDRAGNVTRQGFQ
jgi:hypothetical protein